MNKSITRVLSLTILPIMMLTLFTGCGNKDENSDPLMQMSKEELIATIYGLQTVNQDAENELNSLQEQIDELQSALDARGDVEEKGTITEMEDGTKRLTFNTVDGVITLPVEFAYPGTEMTANTSSINVNNQVKVTPGSTWTAILDGTTLKLSNIEAIAGNITVGQLNKEGEEFKVANLQEYVSTTLLEGFPCERPVWTKLFLTDRQRGVDMTCKTTIDGEPGVIRCGVIGVSGLSIQYMFVYKGEDNSTKNELVRSLLTSMTIKNNPLRIE